MDGEAGEGGAEDLAGEILDGLESGCSICVDAVALNSAALERQ